MYDIVGKRKWYFLFSSLLIVPGILAMIISTLTIGSPFRLGIDFTGGTIMELEFEQPVQPAEVRAIFVAAGYTDTTVQTTNEGHTAIVRTAALDPIVKEAIKTDLREQLGFTKEVYSDSLGAQVGQEVTSSALIAVTVASLAVIGYIVLAFRKVPNPIRYGACAVFAMIHDVMVVLGLFSILGLVLGWEVDALFLTAVLTVIGFSVQDTIVVFDRIRENIPKHRGEPFEDIVNHSLLQTLHRSLVTQINALFVMVALLFFGGATIQQFILAMFVGLISGTYSSIFNAVPLLVVWEKGEIPAFFRRLFRRPVAA
ncbi:MAG: protein translocase subunit SecF [Chloroflexi bacterium]|nr:protein translocase subunit SecF [Chloroflexota bacterium]MBU1747997.1 protein translocase subunit SecF [Chloroflexota bacterium]MBU1877497.1 protein translocase subunit SecF [Chloroflexota bacterium]